MVCNGEAWWHVTCGAAKGGKTDENSCGFWCLPTVDGLQQWGLMTCNLWSCQGGKMGENSFGFWCLPTVDGLQRRGLMTCNLWSCQGRKTGENSCGFCFWYLLVTCHVGSMMAEPYWRTDDIGKCVFFWATPLLELNRWHVFRSVGGLHVISP